MGGLYDAGLNRTLAGTELAGSIHSAANQDALRAQALLSGVYQYGMMPGQTMMDVGGIYEDQARQYLQEDIDRYNYPYASAWDHLNNYSGLMSGLPDFSNQTQQTQGPGRNRTMGALGGAIAGAQAGSSFFPPYGTAIGAVVGGLWGGYSDRRLKRDVEPMGEHRGLPWYRFRYVWDAPGTRRVGVMADEAPPHAVSYDANGFAVVDYGKIGAL